MRELKFRAWDNDFKQMGLVNDAKFVNGRIIGAKGVNWDSKVIVMQFTGLTDKNGKEIYEGDIMKKDYLSIDPNLKIAVFHNGSFGYYPNNRSLEDNFKTFSASVNWNSFEVIGNIYSNPNLLK